MTLDDLQAAVEQAPNALLEMARLDCHAQLVDSIPLSSDEGRLTRVFLAWPGHRLHLNFPGSPGYTVGVHDHRYDLSLRLICGRAVNYHFELAPGEGRTHTEWRFTSGVASGEPAVEPGGVARLRCCGHSELRSGIDLNMRADELHTVWVADGTPTAWRVMEGACRREVTRLFTTTAELETAGLYRRFRDPDQVRERVREFIQVAAAHVIPPAGDLFRPVPTDADGGR